MNIYYKPVSYTHLRAHETCADLVCRLLLEKKNLVNLSTNNYIQSSAWDHSPHHLLLLSVVMLLLLLVCQPMTRSRLMGTFESREWVKMKVV